MRGTRGDLPPKQWCIRRLRHALRGQSSEYHSLLPYQLSNRQCLIYKRLVTAGFLDAWTASDKQLCPDAPTTPSYSIWFRDRLVKLDLWMFKKTVIHSLRGSARDLWREAGTPQKFRNAFTGHASKDVGETKYGTG